MLIKVFCLNARLTYLCEAPEVILANISSDLIPVFPKLVLMFVTARKDSNKCFRASDTESIYDDYAKM